MDSVDAVGLACQRTGVPFARIAFTCAYVATFFWCRTCREEKLQARMHYGESNKMNAQLPNRKHWTGENQRQQQAGLSKRKVNSNKCKQLGKAREQESKRAKEKKEEEKEKERRRNKWNNRSKSRSDEKNRAKEDKQWSDDKVTMFTCTTRCWTTKKKGKNSQIDE